MIHQTGTEASTNYFGFNNKTGDQSALYLIAKIRRAFALILDGEDVTKNVYRSYKPAYCWNPPRITVGDKEYSSAVKEPILDLKYEYDTIKKVIALYRVLALYKEGLRELSKDPNETYEAVYLTSGTYAVNKSRQDYY